MRTPGFDWNGLAAVAGLALLLAAAVSSAPAAAQQDSNPGASTTVTCADPGQPFVAAPEIAAVDGVLRGTIFLTQESLRLPQPVVAAGTGCPGATIRTFRGDELPDSGTANPPVAGFADPLPGPTLRARVGDIVQLSLVNAIDLGEFGPDFDLDDCSSVGANGATYPGRTGDTFPNCLHASSTGNIHFHGTHTNPDTTGDNVYLQLRPLPRDVNGSFIVTPAEMTASFDRFFDECSVQLRNPMNEWPAAWGDLPFDYTQLQQELLIAYQRANPGQSLWDANVEAMRQGEWPQHFIGAVPYCFPIPDYTADNWPPADGDGLVMGQSPGTHWYHAHKHGSTAINVMNGMTGAFIIEGKYDDDINAAYGAYRMADGSSWNTRAQPVMVVNQLGLAPALMTGGNPATPRQLSVNGRMSPVVSMQPGEVQMWRIVNASGRSAMYFMPPAGVSWRWLAIDGVQLNDATYQASLNRPIYIAPGNRLDLLVQAPMTALTTSILVQEVQARYAVQANPTAAVELLKVEVSGPPVTRNGAAAQMPFLATAPEQPPFLADITDEELSRSNSITRTLRFNSVTGPGGHHSINDVQFSQDGAEVNVVLGAIEEWTVVNETPAGTDAGSAIDHPFHIHVNPFQVTEVFDPHEWLTDPATGRFVLSNGAMVPRYVTDRSQIVNPGQCYLDPADPGTWRPCGPAQTENFVWWDVFAIPSALTVTANGQQVLIPGYFKMRSRFVDYPGTYVLHCHILIHEDRGMMFTVSVGDGGPATRHHH